MRPFSSRAPQHVVEGIRKKMSEYENAARQEPGGARAVSDEWSHPEILNLIDLALAEDIGTGDITTECCVREDRMAAGRYFAREDVIVAGIELLPVIYERFGDDVGVDRSQVRER